MNDLARFSKRAVEFIFDRSPRNEDSSPIWCLGQQYDSPVQDVRSIASNSTGTSPAAHSDSGISHADSAVGASSVDRPNSTEDDIAKSFEQVRLGQSTEENSRTEEEDLGWPSAFVDDFESRIWITYRSGFVPIPKSADPAASATMSFTTKMRNLANQGGFTSDTGWGCMIRSGQSLLANTVMIAKLGREWRKGQRPKEHQEILSLFADTPEAPFSIHRFVEHGAQACGTYPGQWFGPSATARCIRALTDKYDEVGLRVYAKPNDADVYVDSLLATAGLKDANDAFQPTLILLGIRLGLDKVTPAYHAGLKAALELPHSVGIAGGRPSSSHYFVGHQGDQFFYLDPHYTRAMLSSQPQTEDIETCHTRRLRRLSLAEMDPSMLLGFLVRDQADFEDWRARILAMPGKAIIHVHEAEPKYATGLERPGAEDEVETLDEDDTDDLAGEVDEEPEEIHRVST